VPVDVDQWGWSRGFYPDRHPGQHQDGSTETFELAWVAFEESWRQLLPEIRRGAFDEDRRDREFRAEIRAVHARGVRRNNKIV
jgi:hypothetical protein